MARFRKLADGEVREIRGKQYVFPHRIRCCDCGLTHLVVMEITGPSKAKFVAWRDRRATAAKRRRRA